MIKSPIRSPIKSPVKNPIRYEIVNLLNNGADYANFTVAGTGTTKGTSGIHLVQAATTDRADVDTSLKPLTTYTVVYNVAESDLTGNYFVLAGAGVLGGIVTLTKNIGINKALITTAASITNNILRFSISGLETDGKYINFKETMIFEGDQRNNPEINQYIPYL